MSGDLIPPGQDGPNSFRPEIRAAVLTDSNYTSWKIVMQTILEARGLWKYCVEKLSSDTKNAEAKALMFTAMNAQQIMATGSCETAHDLWMKIQENNQGAEQLLRNNALAEFLGIKYRPGESIIQYCGRFEVALGRVLATGKQVDDETRFWAFRKTLPKDIRVSINTWSTANPRGEINELISHLKMEFHEDQDLKDQPNAVALYSNYGKQNPKYKPNPGARPPQGNRQNQNNSSKTDESKPSRGKVITCTYCKHPGHVFKECRKLKADNDRKKKLANKGKNDRTKENPQFMLMAEESGNELSNPHSWVIDSGASRYMTGQEDILQNFKFFEHPVNILLGDGGAIEAIGRGDYYFQSEGGVGILGDILWVPDMKQNLISVKQSMERGHRVIFNDNQASIMKDDQLVILAPLVGKLYRVELEPLQAIQHDTALISATIEEWHQRFAHCGTGTL